MSGGISKSDQVLLDSAKDLQTTYDDVTGDLKSMRGELEQLQAQWMGRGGTAFQGAINQWQIHADKVLAAMQAFKGELQSVEATYDATETEVSDVFNKYSSLG